MPECKESCPQLDKLEREVHNLRDQNSEAHREIFKRLNDIERTNAVQDERYNATMDKLDEISTKQDALGEKIGAIEAKPAKSWDKLKETLWVVPLTAILSSIATAIVAFLIAKS